MPGSGIARAPRRSTRWATTGVAAGVVAACIGAAAAAPARAAPAPAAPAPAAPGQASPTPAVTPPPTARFAPTVRADPHGFPAGAAHTGGSVVFDCQKPSAGVETCYGPDQIRTAYKIQPLLDRGITGAGRRIVIVAAFAPPSVAADLHRFDSVFHLPDPHLQIVAPQGAVWDPSDVNQRSWADEIDIDVQWSHVVAPHAKIVLVEARSDSDPDIAAAVSYAVQQRLGDVISQSFGVDERCMSPQARASLSASYRAAQAAGITVVASTGDQGAAQFVCDVTSNDLRQGVSFPASDPRVLAVGGTQLHADLSSGAYRSEITWNDGGDASASATGGGYSTVFGRPDYQDGTVARHARGVPDVAYSSAPKGVIYWGQDGAGGGFYAFYGTSVAVPQWSGLVALGAQLARHRLGLVNPTIYRAARSTRSAELFHDVRVGNNTVHYVDDCGVVKTVRGYRARTGWDAATGVGSPIAGALVPLLAAATER